MKSPLSFQSCLSGTPYVPSIEITVEFIRPPGVPATVLRNYPRDSASRVLRGQGPDMRHEIVSDAKTMFRFLLYGNSR